MIVGCSDSRVAPEIIFDQGVGDLFVVRVAGNVIGGTELDSVEYAAAYLHTPVVLVLGHENCGAVEAVIQGKIKDICSIAKLIQPAIKEVEKQKPVKFLETCIKENAVNSKNRILESPLIQKLVKDGKLEVRAGYYNLKTGAVEFLSH